MARGGTWLPAEAFRPEPSQQIGAQRLLNGLAAVGLIVVLVLRGRYGAM